MPVDKAQAVPVPHPYTDLAPVDNPGYHVRTIPRGVVGEVSKILEEALEAVDADAQGADVMVLVELADLIGAVKAYLAQHHPSLTMEDLETFSHITARAFESGRRPTS